MKSEDRQPIANHDSPTFGEFLRVSTVAYVIMSFVGIEICWWYHKNVWAKFGPITYDLVPLLEIIGASFLFLQICQKAMELVFTLLRDMYKITSWIFELAFLGSFDMFSSS